MAFTLNYETPLAPDATLAAIRTNAAYWQESRVPPSLRRAGVHGVVVEIRAPRFRLRCEHRRWPPPDWFDLRGIVAARPGGGSLVTARVGLARGYWFAPWSLASIAAVVAIGGDWTGGFVAAALAAVIGGSYSRRDRTVTRASDTVAAHLADRLDAALRPSSTTPTVTHPDAAV